MDKPIVTVKQGKLRGIILKSVLGPSYVAFKGIPYALPPIGDLRFKDPKPIAPWTGVRDATKNSECAPQMHDYTPSEITGDEDCLYLNVYTSSLKQNFKPVMFWVHGGSFIMGSGDDTFTRPDYFITKDVVIVSPNYRLGALGFLNCGHKIASGNQGLKDLILALKWVNENISSFGGDPNNVTIFGASAGGALAHVLCLSPASKGLFQKAIFQSGTAISSWSLETLNLLNAYDLAAVLGENSKDPIKVFEFLQKVPWKKIIETQNLVIKQTEHRNVNLSFGVNIDDIAENPALPLPPEQLLSNYTEIPLMLGYSSHECIMFVKDTSESGLKRLDDAIPHHVQKLSLTTKDPIEIARFEKDIRESYLGGKVLSKDNISSFVDLLTDIYFALPAFHVGNDRIERQSAPTFLYRFSYVGNQKTMTNILVKDSLLRGASHVDELSYMFYQPWCKADDPDPPAPGTKDRTTIERLTDMWTNFAKTGNPTPSLSNHIDTIWKPLTAEEFKCLDIGDDLKLSEARPNILSVINIR